MNNSFFNDPGGPWNAGMMNGATAMGNGGTGSVGGGWNPYPGGGGSPWNPLPQPGGGPGLMQMFGGGGGGNASFNDPGGPWNAGMMKGATPMGNGGPSNPGVSLQSLIGLLNGPQGQYGGGGPAALQGYQGGPNRIFNQETNKWQFKNSGYQGGPNRFFNQQTNKWQFNNGNTPSPIGPVGMQGIDMNSKQSPMGGYNGIIQAPSQPFFVPKQGQTNWI
jgi:hypothetical protein